MTPDGKRVFLAWYDVATQNILLGVLGDVTDILVANPSPTPEVAPPTSAPPAAECPKNGIELVAPAGAAATGFAADHADRAGGHGLHDLLRQPGPDASSTTSTCSTEQGGTSIAAGGILTGPAAELLDVPGQPAGTYFYQCDVHPTTMTGTLTVK